MGHTRATGGQASDQANATATQAGADSERADRSNSRARPTSTPAADDSFGSCPLATTRRPMRLRVILAAVDSSLGSRPGLDRVISLTVTLHGAWPDAHRPAAPQRIRRSRRRRRGRRPGGPCASAELAAQVAVPHCGVAGTGLTRLRVMRPRMTAVTARIAPI